MAQQTRSASSRSNGSAPQSKRRSSGGGSNSSAKTKRGGGSKQSQESLATKLKTPAIASAAAIAGVAGGLTLARGRGSRTKSLAKAAKQIGSFGESVGDLASEVRLVREGVAHSQKRSPIEVVLEGLTSRHK